MFLLYFVLVLIAVINSSNGEMDWWEFEDDFIYQVFMKSKDNIASQTLTNWKKGKFPNGDAGKKITLIPLLRKYITNEDSRYSSDPSIQSTIFFLMEFKNHDDKSAEESTNVFPVGWVPVTLFVYTQDDIFSVNIHGDLTTREEANTMFLKLALDHADYKIKDWNIDSVDKSAPEYLDASLLVRLFDMTVSILDTKYNIQVDKDSLTLINFDDSIADIKFSLAYIVHINISPGYYYCVLTTFSEEEVVNVYKSSSVFAVHELLKGFIQLILQRINTIFGYSNNIKTANKINLLAILDDIKKDIPSTNILSPLYYSIKSGPKDMTSKTATAVMVHSIIEPHTSSNECDLLIMIIKFEHDVYSLLSNTIVRSSENSRLDDITTNLLSVIYQLDKKWTWDVKQETISMFCELMDSEDVENSIKQKCILANPNLSQQNKVNSTLVQIGCDNDQPLIAYVLIKYSVDTVTLLYSFAIVKLELEDSGLLKSVCTYDPKSTIDDVKLKLLTDLMEIGGDNVLEWNDWGNEYALYDLPNESELKIIVEKEYPKELAAYMETINPERKSIQKFGDFTFFISAVKWGQNFAWKYFETENLFSKKITVVYCIKFFIVRKEKNKVVRKQAEGLQDRFVYMTFKQTDNAECEIDYTGDILFENMEQAIKGYCDRKRKTV